MQSCFGILFFNGGLWANTNTWALMTRRKLLNLMLRTGISPILDFKNPFNYFSCGVLLRYMLKKMWKHAK